MKKKQLRLLVVASALAIGTTACDLFDTQIFPGSRPSCDSQREVAGWIVTSGLDQDESGELVISKWEAKRDFNTFFGIRITYNTSDSPIPYLQIWHSYKSGDFKMRLPDGTELTTRLAANYAISKTTLRQVDVEALRNQPVRVEHTSHDGKWRVYQTDGLPEAIAAGEADLALAKRKLNDKECSL